MITAPTLKRFGTLIVVLLLAGCHDRVAPSVTPTDLAPGYSQASAADQGHLSVLGTVLPKLQLEVSFARAGAVQRVHVEPGQVVSKGALLARLDTTDLECRVLEAEEALLLSRARLDQARAGPSEQAVAVADAEYRWALAKHEALLAGVRPEEVASAQADYQAALAHYEQVQDGAAEEDLIAARSGMEKAKAALQRAQSAYDLVAARPDIGASPQAAALYEANLDYEAACAQYQRLKNLPTKADLEQAGAALVRAEAQLKLMQAGPTDQELTVSASAVAVAQAQLDLAKTGPRAEDVAVAEIQVQQAQTALHRARQALSQAQLQAPFDGIVSAVVVHPGEWAESGATIVELLDISGWRVETRNVSELSIGRVRVGQQAVVQVIAFRDRELRGQVAAISPVAVVQQGDTTYTVCIEMEPTDLALRPGMNAEVEIETR